MDRRSFMRGLIGAGAAASLGGGFLRTALADTTGGTSPWGPLGAPDANGLRLPSGFSARVVGTSGRPVAGSAYPWHIFPDGAATFPTDDGGWILVSNSEAPLVPATGFSGIPNPGGAGAIRFAADGTIVDAYPVLTGTKVNCAGGPTPWGTWLSCEEWDGGRVWECHPEGFISGLPRRLDAMGAFSHEAAAFDADGRVYLTEDEKDGLLYRFTPDGPGPDGLASGTLEALVVAGGGPTGSVSWVEIPDPAPAAFDYQDEWMDRAGQDKPATPTRKQVAATAFNGGEGCWHQDGFVWFATKGDHRVWRLDVATDTLELAHEPNPGTTLRGVDNVTVHAGTGHVYVAEDGDDMEVQVLVPTSTGHLVAPVLQMTGPGHLMPSAVPALNPPSPFDDLEEAYRRSEVTGPCFNPAGDRLYVSSQRYDRMGITYEITGPFDAPPSA